MPRLLVDVRPLRVNRPFRWLYGGQFVSLLGSNLTLVAVPYQIYRETHSSLWVGLASLIQLPFLVAGSLYGGALGDRGDRRTLLVGSGLVLGALSAGLALNASASGSRLAAVVLLAAASAGAAGFGGSVRTAVIPQVVGDDQLVAAYSLNQVTFNVAAALGPALAGLLLASVGLAWCYGLDAITYGLLTLSTLALPRLRGAAGPPAALWRAIADGFAYVRRHATAQAVYLVDLNAMVFGLPRALFPAVALTLDHGGPRLLGLLYAAPGIGAVAMALVTGWVERVKRQGRLVVLVVILWGVAMALFGAVHVIAVGLVCLAVAGAADVVSTILRNTILQRAITDDFRGRISAIQQVVVTGGPRLGDLEAGAVASLTTTEFSIVSGGVACVIGALALIRWRPGFWRSTDVSDAGAPAAPA
ncbi:MAG TPA: MFS transporter [Acidimicrobiales bacterium]|nr:MFS transporter [Acidimicrobiales bacterium]